MMSKGWTGSLVIMACLAVAVAGPDLSNFRAVFQTDHGDIHMAFYANVGFCRCPALLLPAGVGCLPTCSLEPLLT